MAITINTNMQALKIQSYLNSATAKMNKAMERMTSGYKINSAADDPAGYAVCVNLEKNISGAKVAANNIAIGKNLLNTAEGTLDVVLSNLQRIRDLAAQAANGTYSSDDLAAIAAEADARAVEINQLAGSTNFNGIALLNGSAGTASITLQVGAQSGDRLTLSSSIFTNSTVTNLGLIGAGASQASIINAFATSTAANVFLADCDRAIKAVTIKQTNIGAAQNRLEAAADGNNIQIQNLTATLSTIRDADIAEESSNYIKAQILQQACATLLIQANSAAQIALQLIKG